MRPITSRGWQKGGRALTELSAQPAAWSFQRWALLSGEDAVCQKPLSGHRSRDSETGSFGAYIHAHQRPAVVPDQTCKPSSVQGENVLSPCGNHLSGTTAARRL